MESSKWSILCQLEGDLISAGGAQGRRRSSRLGRRRVAKLSRAHSIFKVSKFLKVKVFELILLIVLSYLSVLDKACVAKDLDMK